MVRYKVSNPGWSVKLFTKSNSGQLRQRKNQLLVQDKRKNSPGIDVKVKYGNKQAIIGKGVMRNMSNRSVSQREVGSE